MSWWPWSPRNHDIEPVRLHVSAPTVSRDETARLLPHVWSCDLPASKARVVPRLFEDQPDTFVKPIDFDSGAAA